MWPGAENVAVTGISSPDRQTHRESLYPLSIQNIGTVYIMFYFCVCVIIFISNFLLIFITEPSDFASVVLVFHY
jgi:hypothetical protein